MVGRPSRDKLTSIRFEAARRFVLRATDRPSTAALDPEQEEW